MLKTVLSKNTLDKVGYSVTDCCPRNLHHNFSFYIIDENL